MNVEIKGWQGNWSVHVRDQRVHTTGRRADAEAVAKFLRECALPALVQSAVLLGVSQVQDLPLDAFARINKFRDSALEVVARRDERLDKAAAEARGEGAE